MPAALRDPREPSVLALRQARARYGDRLPSSDNPLSPRLRLPPAPRARILPPPPLGRCAPESTVARPAAWHAQSRRPVARALGAAPPHRALARAVDFATVTPSRAIATRGPHPI